MAGIVRVNFVKREIGILFSAYVHKDRLKALFNVLNLAQVDVSPGLFVGLGGDIKCLKPAVVYQGYPALFWRLAVNDDFAVLLFLFLGSVLF